MERKSLNVCGLAIGHPMPQGSLPMEAFLVYMPFIPAFLALGLAAGFLAGLLGVGGGIVLVPGLYYAFSALGLPENMVMHAAIGTSLAVIVPTGMASAVSHHKKGAVRPETVKTLGMGILAGVAAGTLIADVLAGEFLKTLFASVLVFLSLIMLIGPEKLMKRGTAKIRHGIADIVAGGAIGCIAALMGIGGATLSVPWMSLRGIPLHHAIGTASALGLVVAVPAAFGFILIGWENMAGQPLFFGYMSPAAWLVIAPAAILAAPVGAAATHRLPVEKLRRLFSFFMMAVALKMLSEICGV